MGRCCSARTAAAVYHQRVASRPAGDIFSIVAWFSCLDWQVLCCHANCSSLQTFLAYPIAQQCTSGEHTGQWDVTTVYRGSLGGVAL